MENQQETPLDEIVWRSPQDVQEMGALHTNTILHYFARSPFFDATSNNATLFTQAMYNPSMYYTIQTREAFEGRLKTMQGLEFIVTQDPSENDTKQNHSGIWVIRKQLRRKIPGQADEVTPIQSYFVVGENVYVAPSIEGVLKCRLLSTVNCLSKMMSITSTLPEFTPAVGHTYLPSPPKSRSVGGSVQATQDSRATTPMPPGSTPKASTQDTASSKTTTAAKLSATEDVQSSQLLELSYDMLLRYGNEYMDENPLMGEPGSFKLSRTREAGLGAISNAARKSDQPFKAAAPVKKAPPPQLQTDLSNENGKKSSVGSAKSPTTPGIKKKKERRKSKAAGVDEVATPKPLTT